MLKGALEMAEMVRSNPVKKLSNLRSRQAPLEAVNGQLRKAWLRQFSLVKDMIRDY